MVKILLVDDDAAIRGMYGKFLRDEGYEVFLAESAEAATEHLISRPVDIALIDINMPGVDGVMMKEVIETYDDKMAVIVSSVYPISEQKKRIPGADEYFDKSHGIEWLKHVIRKTIQLKKITKKEQTTT